MYIPQTHQERLGHLAAAWWKQSERSLEAAAVRFPTHQFLQQYWLNSLLLILLSTRRSVRASTPSCLSCSLVICCNRAMSPASHSKGHADRQPMKVWESVRWGA